MADRKLSLDYLKEALMEPANFWGMAGFAVAAAIPIPRRLVDGRNRKRLAELRSKQRDRLIESFDPREREAVLYLKWLKNKIFDNYVKFTGAKDLPTNIRSLEQRWEDFVDLLDVYRRRKHHLRSINRQAVQNQLTQATRSVETAPDDRSRRIQQANVEILRRRLAQFAELE